MGVRNEPDEEEIKVRGDALMSGIRRDFLDANVSYFDAKELPFAVGMIRQTDGMRQKARAEFRQKLDASIVPVGKGRLAAVKRNPIGER